MLTECVIIVFLFGLVGFYGISTFVGYLMSNHVYTTISNIDIILLIIF